MPYNVFRSVLLLLAIPVVFGAQSNGQQHPNTNATYHQLRELLPGPVTIPVENFTLTRDAATFTFTRGEFALYGEVNGKITGAVFGGSGHFHLTPPNKIERHSLETLTKKPEFDEDFSIAVLRFTDSTADELHKASGTAAGAVADGKLVDAAKEFHTFQREHLFENVDLRLLADLLSPTKSGGFFLAALKGSSDGHILFEIDPHGAPNVAPRRGSPWNL